MEGRRWGVGGWYAVTVVVVGCGFVVLSGLWREGGPEGGGRGWVEGGGWRVGRDVVFM